jgi:hypothetical protein
MLTKNLKASSTAVATATLLASLGSLHVVFNVAGFGSGIGALKSGHLYHGSSERELSIDAVLSSSYGCGMWHPSTVDPRTW